MIKATRMVGGKSMVQDTVVQKKEDAAAENYIFALDIGTRSVIGLVGEMHDDAFHLVDIEIVEHEKRAMLDGQIEDIDQVAKVAGIVKQRLEERLGIRLDKINVAAAGRALKTKLSSFEMALDKNAVITKETVAQLELGAMEKAAEELDQGQDSFFCAGSSVLGYYLDDYKISTLLDHKGERIRVEMIVTFLPEEVVNSLYAVVEKLGAQVESLTLEPIAALNAIIPKELQMLNLALVDIGAGTSDIAVTDRGSVIAYTMATIAGDEVTESLISAYLVDFETAEQIKVALGDGEQSIAFTDILGIENTVTLEEALSAIQPVMEELSTVISRRIMEINERAPRAVFLVGGGSKAPGLRDLIAEALGMDRSKVAVGGNNYMKKTVVSNLDLSAPEYATPVGIAITAARRKKSNTGAVTVNGKSIRIFGEKQPTVSEILLAAGYKYNDIIGRMGKRLSCTVNGSRIFFNGGPPVHCEVTLNGKKAALEDGVVSGDRIEMTPARQGRDAAASIRDAVKEFAQFDVILDGITVTAGDTPKRNGRWTGWDEPIEDGDRIEISPVTALGQVLEIYGGVDGGRYMVNGEPADLDCQLQNNDFIELWSAESAAPVSGKAETAAAQGAEIDVYLNGERLHLPAKAGAHVFMDVLNYMDIQQDEQKRNIVLKLNGQEASFLDVLNQDDDIKISWD